MAHFSRPYQAVSTSGWSPTGPGQGLVPVLHASPSAVPAPLRARCGFCGIVPTGTGVADAGRPTYDGATSTPGDCGTGSQPSGTRTTIPATTATTAAAMPAPRQVTQKRSSTHHRTRGTQSATTSATSTQGPRATQATSSARSSQITGPPPRQTWPQG